MNHSHLRIAGTLLVSGILALNASAGPLDLSASIDGTQVTPVEVPSPAAGEAALEVDPGTSGFNLSVNIVGLINPITAAHLHAGASGENGAPIVTLDIANFEGDANFLFGSFSGTIPSDSIGGLLAGEVYINIHTDAYPDGEIRGQLMLEPGDDNQLLNFSCRGMVNPGNGKAGILIGGFVIGESGETVLMRCIGDGLTKWGLKSLKDTALQVYDINGELVAENDNWKENGQEFAILATGFAPDRDSDAAVILDLPAGAYTVHGDSNQGAGIALVDMYGVEAKTVGGIINSAANGTETAEFTILNQALIDTGLDVWLNGPGPFTLFAPTDEALGDQLDGLDIAAKTEILKYHIIAASYASEELVAGELLTIQGESVTIDRSDGVKVNDAKVIGADLPGTNGYVHVIDRALIPPAP